MSKETENPTVDTTTVDANVDATPTNPLQAVEGLEGADKIAALMKLRSKETNLESNETSTTGESESNPVEPEAPATDNDTVESEDRPDQVTDEEVKDQEENDDQSEETAPTELDPTDFLSSSFVEFLKANPKAMIEVPHKDGDGKTVQLPASKIHRMLGEGANLSTQQQEFDEAKSEWETTVRDVQRDAIKDLDNMAAAFEIAVEPQLKQAYDYLGKGLKAKQDLESQIKVAQPEQKIRLQATMKQIDQAIANNEAFIKNNQPVFDKFMDQKKEAVKSARENVKYTDKRLNNVAHLKHLEDNIIKALGGPDMNVTPIPGVTATDLIMMNEGLLKVLRDGFTMQSVDAPKPVGSTNSTPAKKTTPSDNTNKSKSEKDLEAEIKYINENYSGSDRVSALMALRSR